MSFRHALLAAMLACTSLAVVAATEPTPPAPAPSPTTTAGPAAPAAAPAAAAPVDPDEKVCKVEREIGSNRLKRVCRTRAQIENERAAAREALSREQKN